jgi:hypothetical protein
VERLIPGDRRRRDAAIGEEATHQVPDAKGAALALADPRHRRGLIDRDPAGVEHVVDRRARRASERGHGIVHEIAVDEDVGREVAEGEVRRTQDRGEIRVPAPEVQDFDGRRDRARGAGTAIVIEGALESRFEQAWIGERVRETMADGEAVADDRDALRSGRLRSELALAKALAVQLEGDGPGRRRPVGLELGGILEPLGEPASQLGVAEVEIERPRRIRVVGHQLEGLAAELLQEGTTAREIRESETELAEGEAEHRRRRCEGDTGDERAPRHAPSFDALFRVRIQKRPYRFVGWKRRRRKRSISGAKAASERSGSPSIEIGE